MEKKERDNLQAIARRELSYCYDPAKTDGAKMHNDNCSGCTLRDGGPRLNDAPNYAGWPLVYVQAQRPIPTEWKAAFEKELQRTDNIPYRDNLKANIAEFGVSFS